VLAIDLSTDACSLFTFTDFDIVDVIVLVTLFGLWDVFCLFLDFDCFVFKSAVYVTSRTSWLTIS